MPQSPVCPLDITPVLCRAFAQKHMQERAHTD
uniref:Uncharacterized protein n=1 Tax=Anguilla anguilla TaxID=7936 RepID=A0A0E9RHF0_ANGAN